MTNENKSAGIVSETDVRKYSLRLALGVQSLSVSAVLFLSNIYTAYELLRIQANKNKARLQTII